MHYSKELVLFEANRKHRVFRGILFAFIVLIKNYPLISYTAILFIETKFSMEPSNIQCF